MPVDSKLEEVSRDQLLTTRKDADFPSASLTTFSRMVVDGLPIEDRLIRDAEGATFLDCSKATWWRRVADGTLPPPIKIGGISRWWLSDITDAINHIAENQKK